MIAAFLAVPSPIASASDCAMIKKAILAEENGGYESWKKFHSYQVKLPPNLKVKNIREFVRLIKPVHQSDLRVFTKINANKACFNKTLLATVAKEDSQTRADQKDLDDIAVSMAKLDGETALSNPSKIYTTLKAYYSDFWEILANKSMSKIAGSATPNASPKSSSSSKSTADSKLTTKV